MLWKCLDMTNSAITNVFEGTIPTPAAPMTMGMTAECWQNKITPETGVSAELRDRPEHSTQPSTLGAQQLIIIWSL